MEVVVLEREFRTCDEILLCFADLFCFVNISLIVA